MKIAFLEQEMKTASNAPRSNLGTDDLAVWIEADVESLVAWHLIVKEVMASVKNEKTIKEHEASDTGSDRG
jgi:hypothetical protein